MTANLRQQFDEVFLQLEKLGVLLVSDSFFPNVYQLIAGDSRRGSWWGDEQAHTIFALNEMLEDHPDVLVMKLISGKVTFVHRELWGQIYSIGVAREEWQLRKLSPGAKLLLRLSTPKESCKQTNSATRRLAQNPARRRRSLSCVYCSMPSRFILSQVHIPKS